MSALRIRGLKRAEQQPKPWNPLNLPFSLSLALIDTVKGPGTGNMSLGIIQRERAAYGRARADEKGGRKRRVVGAKSTAISVELLNEFP